MEIFVFDRPVPTESTETKTSPKKCTCLHRQFQRPQSSPMSPPTSSSSNSKTSVNTPNRHSSLMQAATLSAYHPVEPQRTPIKSCSLLNDTENRLDTISDAYEFVDNTKKASYLTGSARCTLNTKVNSKHLSNVHDLADPRSFACNCVEHNNNDPVLLSSPPTFSLASLSSTWNSRIVRKLNSVAHRFNARSYACLISPDRTKLLITPDYEDKHSYSHQVHEVTVIFDIKTYAILRITPARMSHRVKRG